MFNNANQNNNANKGPSVTSTLKTMFCNLSSLRLSYWKDMLSLRFYPCTGTNSNGLYQYDYSKKLGSAISAEKCTTFVSLIEKDFLPAIKKVQDGEGFEKPLSIAIPVGDNGNLIGLKYDIDAESNKPSVFLSLYTGVGADEKAPLDGMMTYRFNKSVVLTDYQPQTGSHTAIEVETEFNYFVSVMRDINAASCAAAHSIASNPGIGKPMKGNNVAPAPYGNQYAGFGGAPALAPAPTYTAPMSEFAGISSPY